MGPQAVRQAESGSPHAAWWRRGVIYQVYPRSFQDSNGDGIGDLEGIRQRLDYFERLGVDILWISPIYPSPMKDFGYDITDYTGIDPIFGTMEDFERLLDEVHARGMRLLMDFVPNHTSDEHPWFKESRSSRDSRKRDWYIWRDPAPDGGPPNNWRSVAGGSAWELDEATGQYYYHAYIVEQPDLNWRNPEVRKAMADVMRFWLEKGVDGFRVDVIWHLIKDEKLRDNPRNRDWRPGRLPYHELVPEYTTDRPEVHDIIEELREVLEEYPERMMVGEVYLPVERLVMYYGARGKGVHLPFNFHLISTPWHAHAVEDLIRRYEGVIPEHGWPNWVLGNHDRRRIATRIGRGQARVAAMLLLTLRGTPTIYYGDEIGLMDVPIPPEKVTDPWEKNLPGLGIGRDPCRTPMQWDASPNAGFTTGDPWLPLSYDWKERNVASFWNDPDNMLTLHRKLLALRQNEPALCLGSLELLPPKGDVVGYIRRPRHQEGKSFLVALNLGQLPGALPIDGGRRGRVVVSTMLDREGEHVEGALRLRRDEGVVVEITGESADETARTTSKPSRP